MDAPNSTVSHVRKFTTRPPKGAVRLTLHAAVGGAQSQKLNTFTVEELADPMQAAAIVEALDELVATMEAPVTAMLTWIGEDGMELGSKAVRRRLSQSSAVDADMVMVEPGAEALAKLDGGAVSLVQQAQKHTEVMTRLYVAALGGQMHTMQKTNEHILELMERMGSQLADQDFRLRKTTAERDAAMEALSQAMGGAGDGAGEPQNGTQSAQSGAIKLITPILENIATNVVMRMMQNPPVPPGPPATGSDG